MTREERAKEYAYKVTSSYGHGYASGSGVGEEVLQAYLQGAKDADDNPAWRMCENELPYPNEDVLVAFENGDRGIGYYESIGDWYVNGIGVVDNIIAWLPLPKFKV